MQEPYSLNPALTEDKKITGRSFTDAEFEFIDTDRVQPNLIENVLAGKDAGVIFRNAVSKKDCDRISENFWRHELLYKRTADAPGYYVGAFHYGKQLEEYLHEAELFSPVMASLFDGVIDPVKTILGKLEQHFAKSGIKIRAAAHKSRAASPYVMRSWAGKTEYALLPHEDEAQCSSPDQSGFEIQVAAKHPLVAVNICLENLAPGGELHYWNILPDNKSRDRLGLTFTGTPYPLESVADFKKQVIPIRQGDVYFFNGKALHAVSSLACDNAKRATISFLMAKLDSETIIYWA